MEMAQMSSYDLNMELQSHDDFNKFYMFDKFWLFYIVLTNSNDHKQIDTENLIPGRSS